MIEYRKITIPVNQGKASFLFKKYSDSSDWICQMEPETMEILEELLECDNEH